MGELRRVTDTFQLSGNHISLDFVNTVDDRATLAPKEGLQSYADLVAWGEQTESITANEAMWLVEAGTQRPDEAAEILRETVMVREALFHIFTHIVNEETPREEDLQVFNVVLSRVMSKARIVSREALFIWDWYENAQEMESVLWPVVRASADLLTSQHLRDVRICASDDCQWLFLDTSKNHSRRWCDMKTCGNRAKVHRHNKRKKQEVTSDEI
jgi:predicted RNA-binding Zn ribbon-like protein